MKIYFICLMFLIYIYPSDFVENSYIEEQNLSSYEENLKANYNQIKDLKDDYDFSKVELILKIIGRLKSVSAHIDKLKKILFLLKNKNVRSLILKSVNFNLKRLEKLTPKELDVEEKVLNNLSQLMRIQKIYIKYASNHLQNITKDELDFISYLISLPEQVRPPLSSKNINGRLVLGVIDIIKLARKGDDYINFIYNSELSKVPESSEAVEAIYWALYKKALKENNWDDVSKLDIKILDAYELYNFVKKLANKIKYRKQNIGTLRVNFNLLKNGNLLVNFKESGTWKSFLNSFLSYFSSEDVHIITPLDLIRLKFLKLSNSIKNKTSLFYRIKAIKGGISSMYSYIKNNGTPSMLKEFQDFIALQGLNKDLNLRKGSEVILKLKKAI